MKLHPTALLTACVVLASRAGAQQSAPVPSDEAIRQRESRVTLRTAVEEAAKLKERLLVQESAIKALTESLAISNSESEMFKRDSADLKMKIEALGVETVEGNSSKIEQRLLAAVRDLRLAQEDNDALRKQLVRLSESILATIQTSSGIDPQARMVVETEVRRTNELLSAPNSATPTAEPVDQTLLDGQVVDVKQDLALAVVNLGSRHGVKVGMPFQVLRNTTKVGEVRVVDVRERIAGAVVQSLVNPSDQVRVGDRLRVITR